MKKEIINELADLFLEYREPVNGVTNTDMLDSICMVLGHYTNDMEFTEILCLLDEE